MRKSRGIRLTVLTVGGALAGLAVALLQGASGARGSLAVPVLVGANVGALLCAFFFKTNASAQHSIDWIRSKVRAPKGAQGHVLEALREVGILWMAFAVLEPAIKAEMKLERMEVLGVVVFLCLGILLFGLGVFFDREVKE